MTLSQRLLFMAGFAGFFIGTAYWNPVLSKDNGQWDNVPQDIREWFRGLKNNAGVPCCSEADGHQIDSSDWWIDDRGRFVVRFGGREFLIPEDKVITVPNRIGVALLFINEHGHVYCFLAGSLS